MKLTRAIVLPVLLWTAADAGAQINIYLGGNLQGNYSWLREEGRTYNPGFGGGFSFVYWEYEYWFLKAGIDYGYKSSSGIRYPDDYGVEVTSPDDQVQIDLTEQVIGVPLSIYFRPFESGENTLLLVGTLQMMFVAHLKEDSEQYGELILKGDDVKHRTKTNLGIGAGYQRQLDQHLYLNIYPSFHLDIRAERPFNSVNLTAELLFGVY